ncbi:MAG: nicotinate-nucleotide adenylyltransferase [Pyrinomonadaceae bacterium]
MKRIGIYGGSFDPVHRGHLLIGRRVREQFGLDELVFMPACQAPHKRRSRPTAAIDRYTMLCLATEADASLRVSRLEIERPDHPYTFETLTTLKSDLPNDRIFFVMGADSWADITTWFRWEDLLALADHIVVTRPGHQIATDHVPCEVRDRIVDCRGVERAEIRGTASIYFTDAVNVDISATRIRSRAAAGDDSWRSDVPENVANYIEKYQIYS